MHESGASACTTWHSGLTQQENEGEHVSVWGWTTHEPQKEQVAKGSAAMSRRRA